MVGLPMTTIEPEAALDFYESDARYEIVDGQRVEVSPMSTYSTVVSFEFARLLCDYGLEHEIGRAYHEVLIKLSLPRDRQRRPDVCFVSHAKWPRGSYYPNENAWAIVPDLCVEVVSPSDRIEELYDKVREYFEAGVQLVWVVHPRHGFVQVHASLTQVRGVARTEVLDGGPVLPGFRLPLAELLPQPR